VGTSIFKILRDTKAFLLTYEAKQALQILKKYLATQVILALEQNKPLSIYIVVTPNIISMVLVEHSVPTLLPLATH
jgi:hypothetical protein